MSQRTAILLLAHGTPDKLSEMAEYLQKVTGGRPMPPEVVEELQHRYAQIGLTDAKPAFAADGLPEGPPLTRWTLLQTRMLSEMLSSSKQHQPVYIAMRNWHPYIADVVAQMKADGVEHARVLCLAPQNSRTSTGLYRRALMAAVGDAFTVDFISGWADEPLLAQAFAERLWPAWAEACAVTRPRQASPSRPHPLHRPRRPLPHHHVQRPPSASRGRPSRRARPRRRHPALRQLPKSRPLPGRVQTNRPRHRRRPSPRRPHRRRLVLRLPIAGHRRRPLDRTHRPRHPQGPRRRRPQSASSCSPSASSATTSRSSTTSTSTSSSRPPTSACNSPAPKASTTPPPSSAPSTAPSTATPPVSPQRSARAHPRPPRTHASVKSHYGYHSPASPRLLRLRRPDRHRHGGRRAPPHPPPRRRRQLHHRPSPRLPPPPTSKPPMPARTSPSAMGATGLLVQTPPAGDPDPLRDPLHRHQAALPQLRLHGLSATQIVALAAAAELSLRDTLARLHDPPASTPSTATPSSSTTRSAPASPPPSVPPQTGSAVHRTAHQLGLSTTATMVFGVGETFAATHRPSRNPPQSAGGNRRLHLLHSARLHRGRPQTSPSPPPSNTSPPSPSAASISTTSPTCKAPGPRRPQGPADGPPLRR